MASAPTFELTAPPRTSYWEIRTVVPGERQRCFRLWTIDHLMRRWMIGPGSVIAHVVSDPRRGGRWRYEYVGPDSAFHQAGMFRIFDEGTFFEAPEDVIPGYPISTAAVTFEDAEGGTQISYRTAFTSERDRDRSMDNGYPDNVRRLLARLHHYLTQHPEIDDE